MEKEFCKNRFGATIVKCCASCKHKVYDKGCFRVCQKGEGIVQPSSICGDWEMSPSLSKAGIGGGHVKKRHYLKFVLDYTQPEDPRQHKGVMEKRREYELLFGSIYLNEKVKYG